MSNDNRWSDTIYKEILKRVLENLNNIETITLRLIIKIIGILNA